MRLQLAVDHAHDEKARGGLAVIAFGGIEIGKENDVERESAGIGLKTQSCFRSNFQTALRVMRLFIFGLVISSYCGSELMAIRMPHSNWRFAPIPVLLIGMVLELVRKDDTKVPVVFGCLWPIVFGGCVTGLFFIRAIYLVPVAFGAVFAIFFWAQSKSKKIPYLFLSAGSLLAGALSLQAPWPNEQRCLLTLVGVGLTATLQGAWVIVRYLQGHCPAELLEPPSPPRKQSDRAFARIAHLICGRVESVQISNPELVQNIRTKYQAEITQLVDIKFDLLFFYGEAFSFFRLFLLLPAIYVIDMWIKRVPVSIHHGTKVLVGNPVFISKNKDAFGHPNTIGVSFDTLFQDGTILA